MDKKDKGINLDRAKKEAKRNFTFRISEELFARLSDHSTKKKLVMGRLVELLIEEYLKDK